VAIINKSLQSGSVPECFKVAMITPVLKKQSLDRNMLKNYRPVSNLPFLSKVLERVVAKQLLDHISANGLHEHLQSAYKSSHSTETALIKVHSDLLCAMDQKGISILILLDLSAAFDTINHTGLLAILEHDLGLTGTTLGWFKSYLTSRIQQVHVAGKYSPKQHLLRGVPQGSVLGPLLFLIYTRPLGRLIRNHGLKFHLYADDTQLYMTATPASQQTVNNSVAVMEDCVHDIQTWMTTNFLKLNAEKTEVLLIGSAQQSRKFSLNSIRIGNISVEIKSEPVKNLGVLFDTCLSMTPQVNSLCKKANFQLANIRKVRKLLTAESTTKLVCSLVLSRLDYCNALLQNIPNSQLQKLQLVQNSAARLVCGLRKYDHITQTLIDLHWLPIKFRIVYKILTIVYKSLHKEAPEYINNMLVPYRPQRKLRSASEHLLVVRQSKCKTLGGRAFACCAPSLWNSLPIHLKKSPSLENFKSNLKTHLFAIAYSQ
jgi:hypothetical protein